MGKLMTPNEKYHNYYFVYTVILLKQFLLLYLLYLQVFSNMPLAKNYLILTL